MTQQESLQELHIPVGNRKPGSRALFFLWLNIPTSQLQPEWVDGQMGGWTDDGRVGGGMDAWLSRRRARRTDTIKGALAASAGSDKRVGHSALRLF